MIDRLEALQRDLPALLDRDDWRTALIDKHPPTVRRAWLPTGPSERLYVHESMPHTGDAFWHAHPWPCCVKVLSGQYEMGIAHGLSCAAVVRVERGMVYEMLDPGARHYVRVLGGQSAFSLMLTGKPFEWHINEWRPNTERPRLLTFAERSALFTSIRRAA